MAEPTTGVRFAGVLRDGSGNLITSGVTANSYDIGTTTPTRGTEDSTFTSGKFGISDSGFGRFDVKIVNGSEQIWWSSLAEVQVTSMQVRNPTASTAGLEVFSTESTDEAVVAVFGFRPATESSGVETADAPSNGDRGHINFELSNDNATPQQYIAGRLAWETVDKTDGSEDGQFNFWTMQAGTLVEELHLSGAALWPEADAGLDLGTTALGFNDLHLGSGGIINLDGGDVTLTHSSGTLTYGGDGAVSVAFGANVDLQFTGGTGTNEIVLANGLADALSITDGSADVIAISTAGGTNTVAITGDLTVSGTIAADTAAVATTVTITDNEDTDEANAIIFTSGGDVDGGNIGLESDGTLNYNPSTGTLTSTVFVGNLTGNASGTAATVTGGTQASITAAANLVTVGTIASGTLGAGAAIAGVTVSIGSDADGDTYYRSSNVLTRLAKGSDGEVLTLASGVPSWAAAASGTTEWDAIVAASGGDYTSIQTAADALDGAGTGAYNLYVKGGQTYTEAITINDIGAIIYIEGGTTITGNLIISGANTRFEMGPGCTLTGTLTLSGNGSEFIMGQKGTFTGVPTLSGNSVLFKMGGLSSITGIITHTGADGNVILGNGTAGVGYKSTGVRNHIDGGGHDTVMDATTVTNGVFFDTGGDGGVASNISAQTTAGQANSWDAFSAQVPDVSFYNCRVLDSDRHGFNNGGTGRISIVGCFVDSCDDNAVDINGPSILVSGMIALNAGGVGVDMNGSGDNSVITGSSFLSITGANPITIDTNAENCVVVGNRLDGAVSDSSGTSTVASNDET